MGVEWASLCRAKGFEIDEPFVDVVEDVRRQHIRIRIHIDEAGEYYHLTSIVARRSIVSAANDLPMQVWLRNRHASLVGFWIDDHDRLIGESWVPKAGLSDNEFQFYLRQVAKECDGFEYALTGTDG